MAPVPRPTDAPKQPFHITRGDGQTFAFAGLWSIWHAEPDDTLRTCTILTTAANAAIAPIHDRMPVILDPEAESAWLDTSTPRSELREILAGLPRPVDRGGGGRLRGQRRALLRPGVPRPRRGAASRKPCSRPVLRRRRLAAAAAAPREAGVPLAADAFPGRSGWPAAAEFR